MPLCVRVCDSVNMLFSRISRLSVRLSILWWFNTLLNLTGSTLCFVMVYLIWCNFVRLSVQSVLWWFICYGVTVANYTNKIQKPKSSHKKLKKLTKGIQHKFWQFIPTWFSFKVRFKVFFFFLNVIGSKFLFLFFKMLNGK